MVNSAIVCTVRGQVGLFFPELTVRLLYFKNEFEIFQLSICRNLHSLRQDRVPKDWIPEQLILRFRFWLCYMNAMETFILPGVLENPKFQMASLDCLDI